MCSIAYSPFDYSIFLLLFNFPTNLMLWIVKWVQWCFLFCRSMFFSTLCIYCLFSILLLYEFYTEEYFWIITFNSDTPSKKDSPKNKRWNEFLERCSGYDMTHNFFPEFWNREYQKSICIRAYDLSLPLPPHWRIYQPIREFQCEKKHRKIEFRKHLSDMS